MSVTIKDVAREAGVSVCTVSRILNGKASVYPFSDKTRERVARVAQELGYSPSVLGRGMRTGKTYTVGLTVRAENVHHASCVKTQYGLSQAFSRRSYCLVTLHISGWRPSIERQLARFDGLVIGPNMPEDVLAKLQALSLPKVELDTLSDNPVDCVNQDAVGMGRSLGKHLAELGYRRFVMVGSPRIAQYSVRRHAGLHGAAKVHGIETVTVDENPRMIREYLSTHSREALRQTVFVAVRGVAGMSAACYIGMGMGMEVPRDFGLATCHLEPPDATVDSKQLTGVTVDVPAMGAAAGDMLLEKLSNENATKPSVTFGFEIAEGETTRRVP